MSILRPVAAATTATETYDLLAKHAPWVKRPVRDVATWRPISYVWGEPAGIHVIVTTWGLRDVVGQCSTIVPTLRDAWRVLAMWGVVHRDRVGDSAAFLAWCQLGRR